MGLMTRMSWLWVRIRTCSWLWARPIPMWCIRELNLRAMLPSLSTRSSRIRQCPSVPAGVALPRARLRLAFYNWD